MKCLFDFICNFGNINNKQSTQLRKVELDDPCPKCPELGICGGRCLFANKTKYWGEDGFDLICKVNKRLFKKIREIYPKIKKLIDEGRIIISIAIRLASAAALADKI